MSASRKISLLVGGLLLTLAAFPVLAQEAAPTPIAINRRPLMDLSATVNDQLASKEIDLTAAFAIEIAGALNADGKLDTSKSKYTRTEGDPRMVDIAKKSIEAVNDSGYLQYLRILGARDMNLSVVQDDAAFTVSIQTELESAARAGSVKTMLDIAIKYYKDKKSGPGADGNDAEDLLLLKAASVTNDGKKLLIKFAMPKADFQTLIQKKLSIHKPVPAS